MNQIEINPFLHRANTVAFFQREGVVLQSYRALRNGKAFAHPAVVAVAAKHARSPAQVLGRWCVQHGYVYLPKSVRKGRMRENADVFGWTLDAAGVVSAPSAARSAALETFRGLYRKCVLRDTPDAGNAALIRSEITVD